MISVKKILDSVDTSKIESWTDISGMADKEFEIHDYPFQEEGKERITSCYYYSWICTDTKVGILVYYLDGTPVCISFKPYRKASVDFFWLSEEAFYVTRECVLSLTYGECDIKNGN